jgi:hypothetical protein
LDVGAMGAQKRFATTLHIKNVIVNIMIAVRIDTGSSGMLRLDVAMNALRDMTVNDSRISENWQTLRWDCVN